MPPQSSPSDAAKAALTIEQKNRVVLLLFLVFLLGIFMDYQARRHYKSIGPTTEKLSPSSFEKDLEKAQKKLEQELKKQGTGESASIPIPAKAESIVRGWSGLKEKIVSAAKEQRAAELYAAEASRTDAKTILTKLQTNESIDKNSTPPLDQIEYKQKYYLLYFIRFYDKKSKLIHVRRPHNGGRLRLRKVLEALHKGPSLHEKGLLNNFDSHIKINSIRKADRTAWLDLNTALGRMGAHVIHDRLEQIAHTLTQFPQIDRVKITIDGQSPPYIGEAKVLLPRILQPKRPSFAWKP